MVGKRHFLFRGSALLIFSKTNIASFRERPFLPFPKPYVFLPAQQLQESCCSTPRGEPSIWRYPTRPWRYAFDVRNLGAKNQVLLGEPSWWTKITYKWMLTWFFPWNSGDLGKKNKPLGIEQCRNCCMESGAPQKPKKSTDANSVDWQQCWVPFWRVGTGY